jgi:methylenetetrahydrofolate dehydrogenase (NADP+) / methenyltetrahydrofolate cyclohydrolase
MPAEILDGRALAAELRDGARGRSEALRKRGVVPRLVVVLVGDDGSSRTYVESLVRLGRTTGIDVDVDELDAATDAAQLCARLDGLGADGHVHGVILQQPLPKHLDVRTVAAAVPVGKDIDGANPLNAGRLFAASGTAFVPATPAAVMLLLARSTRWPLRGARACIVGRSTVVGLPLALLLLRADATLTITHRGTRDLAHHTRDAEILIAASGAPGLITAGLVAPDATVIDVGTTYVDGKLVGDVAYAEVAAIAREITPVPGGVGPVTNVALMQNVLAAAEATVA